MPIILEKSIVNVINGPKSIYFLKQRIMDPELNKNFLFFLGDTHSMEHFTPCFNDPDCTELQTDFMQMLNSFASTRRIDFYLEDFLTIKPDIFQNQRSLKNAEDVSNKVQQVYYNLYNDPQLRISKSNGIVDAYEEEIKKNMYRIRNGRSNMTELGYLNNSCFYQPLKEKLCKFPNINWHYADARQSLKYSKKNYSIEGIAYSTNEIKKFLNEYFVNKTPKKSINMDNLEELCFNMSEFEKTPNIIELLQDIHIIVTNSNVYIEKLLAQPLFVKQLKKMNPKSKSIYNIESFVALAESYKDYFNKTDFTGFINIIELLIEYYKLCPDGQCSEENKEFAKNIIDKLNSLVFDSRTIQDYSYVADAVGNCAMDIYYILRINKIDNGTEPNKKLVVSYFGSIHSDKLTNYFTNIVKTHELIGHYNAPHDIRRIAIPDVINLNELIPIPSDVIQIEVPIRVNRSRTSKSRTSKSRTSKSRTSKSRTSKSRTSKSKSSK
uniref:Uncharacterized protein n=1 Tax=viral metagenome TaxID=1070528 RepID=A0A6C0HZH4_9ZZZZ